MAVLFGATGVVFTAICQAGLAATLWSRAPTLSAATALFGCVGNVGDGLVALAFRTGIPSFPELASRNRAAAHNAWGAFATITGGFQALGKLLLGLLLLTAS